MFMMQPEKTQNKTEHFPYDVCNCDSCLEEADKVEYDEDFPKKKGSQRSLKKRYEAGDPCVVLLGEPSGKFDYYVLYEFQRYGSYRFPKPDYCCRSYPELAKRERCCSEQCS
ncbi:hypothetical protein L1987_87139 [Smallanthus sonchifolius]|nr:hypothetical protein L1987_87139 [Smallanthus sonchifolius]